MASSSLSRSQLDQLARLGAQARIAEIQAEVIALESIIGGRSRPSAATPTRQTRARRRGTLSAAGRAAISRAQKARWAKMKGKAQPQATGRKGKGKAA